MSRGAPSMTALLEEPRQARRNAWRRAAKGRERSGAGPTSRTAGPWRVTRTRLPASAVSWAVDLVS